MGWKLLEEAEKVEEVASALHVFLKEVPDYDTDIAANLSDFFAVSAALRALDREMHLDPYGRESARIIADVDLVCSSLQYTMDVMMEMYGYTEAEDDEDQYTEVWEDLAKHFKDEGPSLGARLVAYRAFLKGLNDELKGETPDDDMGKLESRLKRLVRNQMPVEVDEQLESLSLSRRNSRRSIRTKSTERARSRTRPKPRRPSLGSRGRTDNSYFSGRKRRSLPIDEPVMPGAFPPAAPEVPTIRVPTSPTFSSSSETTFSGGEARVGSQMIHWGASIFDGQHPSTKLRQPGKASKCLGRDDPTVISRLNDEQFVRVVEQPFDASTVSVRLYWRQYDRRARVLFLTKDPSGQKLSFCIPLTALRIIRTKSSLQLCRVNRSDGGLDLWASLKFTEYERMVLLYCTMVALKRQDYKGVAPDMDDIFQPGEKELFGGEIIDDRQHHALRVYKDEDSGGVRFEATPLAGKMRKTPIWTAFVTGYVGDKKWLRPATSTTVQVREMHPYVFVDNYDPPKGRNGKYELRFGSEDDADSFLEMFQSMKKASSSWIPGWG